MDDTASLHSLESDDTSRPLPMTFDRWKNACMGAPSDTKDKIRAQATQIFAFLSKHIEHKTPENVVMTTKSSHNEALAQLVQELGPAFSDEASYASRCAALYCIFGAIEGCSEASLSYKITNLLGNFFLGQCGPLEPEDNVDEDTDEEVRDAALLCLSALVGTQIQEPPIHHDAIQLHLDLARKGVERRCAVPYEDEDMQYDHGYEFPATRTDIRGGLSTLPRSRRSLCFDLVRSAIDGLAQVPNDPLQITSVTSHLASFASFAGNCLHGESDPRCLMQLLQMLHAMQTNMLPFFETKTATVTRFPILNLFDAVAPYYPIHFTPPPNDVFGITRQGLHGALMAVLCFTGYDAMEPGNDTMLNLSAGIFLERLINVDSEDANAPSTADDKLEAINDLSSLLFRPNKNLCEQLSEDAVRELSTVLFVVHAEAASGVSSGGESGRKYKMLADSCRNLVAKIAFALEISSQTVLWNVFVRDTVQTRCQVLATSPQSSQGRSSVAYLACLSSCGGVGTMNLCFQSCVPNLINILNEEKDQEKVVAAMYGVGAFFSSFRVSFDRGTKEGVAFHPHPLEPFSSKACRSLFQLMGIVIEGENKEVDPSLYIAGVHALESVLTVTPLSLLEESDIDNICGLLDAMASLVDSMNEIFATEIDLDSSDVSLRKAAARTLGSTLGTCLGETSSTNKTSQIRCVIDESDKIHTHLRESVYPKLLLSSDMFVPPKNESEPLRFDWMTLAYACEMNQASAKRVITDLVDALDSALKGKDAATTSPKIVMHFAMRFSFIIQRGGARAMAAFDSLLEPNASPVELIKSLCSLGSTAEEKAMAQASPEKTVVTRVSTLMLPPTSQDTEEVDSMVERAYSIIPYLIPAYEQPFSQPQMESLVKRISQVIPPLSVWQSVQLSVSLPFLSAVLSQGTYTLQNQTTENRVLVSLHSMVPYLTDCAMNSDFDARARSAAASCLFYLIARFQDPDAADCLSRGALSDIIMPSIVVSAENLSAASNETAEKAMVDLCESLDLAGLLGTAAACRGKSSSKNADLVASFLIKLSCDGTAQVPFVNDITMVDISGGNEAMMHFAASSAFGSMISTEDGGPFWRQRLVHMALRHLRQASNGLDTKSMLSAASLTPTEIGCLLTACFVIASSGATSLGEESLNALADRIMLDFCRIYAEGSETNETIISLGSQMYSVKEMVLAAVVKLMAVAPATVAKYNSTLVPSLLHAYNDSFAKNPMMSAPCKILALQGLVNAISFLEHAKSTLLALKPVVVSVLSSDTDNSSSIIRQAAIDTRNAWYTIN